MAGGAPIAPVDRQRADSHALARSVCPEDFLIAATASCVPAACGGARRSPWRCHAGPASCLPTSRRRRSIPRCRSRSGAAAQAPERLGPAPLARAVFICRPRRAMRRRAAPGPSAPRRRVMRLGRKAASIDQYLANRRATRRSAPVGSSQFREFRDIRAQVSSIVPNGYWTD